MNCIKVASWHVDGPYADKVCDKRCGFRTATNCKVTERNNTVNRLYPVSICSITNRPVLAGAMTSADGSTAGLNQAAARWKCLVNQGL
jgi:hypothetical protein